MTSAAREQRSRRHVVPDVVGLGERDAQIMLRNVGFQTGEVVFVESYAADRTVVSSDPAPGHMVPGDTLIRLHVSRQNLMRFLPSAFQGGERGTESDFLRRFLWVITHLHDSVNDRMGEMTRLFKPFETDPEFLPWLASWLGLTLDTDWSEEKKRRFIQRASQLYTVRGTSRALREILEVFTGVRPEIVENAWPYDGFRIGVSSSVGVDTVMLPPMNLAHCFIVRLPIAVEEIDEAMLVKIHQIIQQEKPAHTTYFLAFEGEEDGVGQHEIEVDAESSSAETAETPSDPVQPDQE